MEVRATWSSGLISRGPFPSSPGPQLGIAHDKTPLLAEAKPLHPPPDPCLPTLLPHLTPTFILSPVSGTLPTGDHGQQGDNIVFK